MVDNRLVILTKETIDRLLKEKEPMGLMSLYTFYYYTSKWQETNVIKCTTNYVSKGLKISENKVRSLKKTLIQLGLIEDVKKRNKESKFEGHYIKVNYVMFGEVKEDDTHTNEINKDGVKNHTNEKREGGKNERVDFDRTNALSTNNLNALTTNNLNALNTDSDFQNACKHIIEYLNEKGNGAYQWKAKSNQDLIRARFKEGYTIQDFELVIDYKCWEWLKDKEMIKYLQPSTLFGKTNFIKYIQQANTQLKREESKPKHLSDEMIIEMAKKGEL